MIPNSPNQRYLSTALRCLLVIKDLNAYFAGDKFKQDINENSPCKGKLAEKYAEFTNVGSSVGLTDIKKFK